MSVPVARAVLFDVDGTLVDSNYLHVDAWHRAFRKVGVFVDAWKIHRRIGMDSDRMLSELLGDDAARVGDEAKHAHSRFYRKATPRLRAFTGIRDLLDDLEARGMTVVLATSAPSDELELLVDALGIEPDRLISTNADDVETAKPHPGIVGVALEHVGATPSDAVFVGDSVWDMIAARAAGVHAIGVLSGGVGAEELREAGAELIIDGAAELMDLTDERIAR